MRIDKIISIKEHQHNGFQYYEIVLKAYLSGYDDIAYLVMKDERYNENSGIIKEWIRYNEK
jgi:hypothetical protein